MLLVLTDVPAVIRGLRHAGAASRSAATPAALRARSFPAGSMGPEGRRGLPLRRADRRHGGDRVARRRGRHPPRRGRDHRHPPTAPSTAKPSANAGAAHTERVIYGRVLSGRTPSAPRRGPRARGGVTGSTWKVAWWMSKCVGHAGAEASRVAPTPVLGEARVGDGDVRRERGDAAGDGPGVQVVHVGDAGTSSSAAARPRGRAPGRDLEQDDGRSRAAANARGRMSRAISRWRSESALVKPVVQITTPAMTASSEPEQVGEHLVDCAAHVQRAVLGAAQHHHRDAVGDQADRGEDDDRPGIDGLGRRRAG